MVERISIHLFIYSLLLIPGASFNLLFHLGMKIYFFLLSFNSFLSV